MEVFRELRIRGDGATLAAVMDEISRELPRGWTRDRALEDRLSVGGTGPRTYCFSTEEGSGHSAVSFFLVEDATGSLSISNIIPRDKNQLPLWEFNEILEDFAEKIVRPVLERYHAEIELTEPHADLDRWLSTTAAKQLRTFSRLANKSMGSAHPSDQKRWFDFLRMTQREESRLDAETLRRWLIESEGWFPEVAEQLASEYEFGRKLLSSSAGN